MAENIMIKGARLSFPSLFKKAVFDGAEGKYEGTFLFPKSDKKTHKVIMDAIATIKSENKAKVGDDKLCIKDGDTIDYDGYEGMWAVKASNTKRPTVINRDKSPLTEDDEVLYAGCYVDVIINLWYQNNKFGKRVNANLLGVRFVKGGDPFGDGAKVADADEFDDDDDYEDDEDDF